MEDGFRLGDVVQIKSGGRQTTVGAIREGADGIKIDCAWCEPQGMGGEADTRDFFPPQALDKVGR